MMKLRHIAPLVFVVTAAACSKDQPPAESPGGEATAPPSSESSDMDGGSTMPNDATDGGEMKDEPMGQPGTDSTGSAPK